MCDICHNFTIQAEFKIFQFIGYRGLDMNQFYIGNRPANEPPPIYDLYGVINHYGGILGGHYTAYARTPDIHNTSVDEQG